MNILYVTDDKGVMFLGVSLESLLENNLSHKDINIFVIDDGITEKNKRLLDEEAERFQRKITYIKKPEIKILMGVEPDSRKWPDNIFCRLFLPTIFKDYKNIERIIYLDTDTIVTEDLSGLWNEDISGYPCGAVLECMSNLHKECIGLKMRDPYLNSGMLLIDINQWRELSLEEKCKDFGKTHLSSLEYPDEGIINGVLQGKFKVLHPKYNNTTLKNAFSYSELKVYRKSAVMYSEEEYEEAVENPTIIHFTNSFMVDRPWIKDSKKPHRFSGLWREYQDKTVWRGELLNRKKASFRTAMESVARVVSRKVVVPVMGFFYCYIKPLKYLSKRVRIL